MLFDTFPLGFMASMSLNHTLPLPTLCFWSQNVRRSLVEVTKVLNRKTTCHRIKNNSSTKTKFTWVKNVSAEISLSLSFIIFIVSTLTSYLHDYSFWTPVSCRIMVITFFFNDHMSLVSCMIPTHIIKLLHVKSDLLGSWIYSPGFSGFTWHPHQRVNHMISRSLPLDSTLFKRGKAEYIA